jgi:hypothetical protein
MLEDAWAETGVFATEGGGKLVAGIEGRGGEFENVSIVDEPAGAIEEEPAPGGDVAHKVTELLDETAGVASVGEIVSGEQHERDVLIVGGAVLGWSVLGRRLEEVRKFLHELVAFRERRGLIGWVGGRLFLIGCWLRRRLFLGSWL